MKKLLNPILHPSKLHRKILRWYTLSGRILPWRKTRNPYRILLSEIMLQQTQVNRVKEKYGLFLREFSGFKQLARADTRSILMAWRGMGYNNRAVRLRELARVIMRRYDGVLPRNIEELQTLPGIGPYTAHAVACFAFRAHVPIVDTNIARVFSRLFPKNRNQWKIAAQLLPAKKAYDWNQALMDLGATVCTVNNPDCSACPAVTFCPSAHRAQPRAARVSRPEPGRNGIPNRIYRGRIIEVLRNRNGLGSIHADRLGPLIKAGFSVRDINWLRRLLFSLERDGLVRVSQWGSRFLVSFS